MKVWHGTAAEFDSFHDTTTFFSTDRDFAADYAGSAGRVLAFEIPEKGLLDCRNPEQLARLIGGGPIEDPYDGTEYPDAQSFLAALGGDIWEGVEQYVQDARAMGYAGMIVTEGGTVNVALFDPWMARMIEEDQPSPAPM